MVVLRKQGAADREGQAGTLEFQKLSRSALVVCRLHSYLFASKTFSRGHRSCLGVQVDISFSFGLKDAVARDLFVRYVLPRHPATHNTDYRC